MSDKYNYQRCYACCSDEPHVFYDLPKTLITIKLGGDGVLMEVLDRDGALVDSLYIRNDGGVTQFFACLYLYVCMCLCVCVEYLMITTDSFNDNT